MVVYDPQSKELLLRKDSHSFVGSTDCPFCHRPLNDNSPFEDEQDGSIPNDEHSFVNPDYFRMLAHSVQASPSSSRPPSPFKQLPQLHGDGLRSAADQAPPSNAEFVGSTPAPQSGEQGIRGSSFVPNYFKSFFVEKRELGRGGRGVVLLVEHVLDDVSLGEFACKRIPVGNAHGWLEKVLVEVQLLQRLNHQNLVSYRHVWLEDAQITSFGPSVPCIFILQQYCNAGDLHDYVLNSAKTSTKTEDLKERMRRKSKGQPDTIPQPETPRRMQFEEIFSFFRDITSGLHHLHTNGFIHRDLKPSNCLLHRTGQNKLTLHVSDFGEVQATSAQRTSTGATGTLSYCAPEVLRRDGPGGRFGDFTTKSDIFSLGMIVYFMCFGHLPYINADEAHDENEDVDKLRAEVTTWRGFDESIRTRTDLPDRLYSFLKRLLSPNPAERPSTERILQVLKTGGDIDLQASPIPDLGESNSPRITSVDTPVRSMSARSRPRKASNGLVRPGLSTLGRHRSSADIIRSPSPKTVQGPMTDSPARSESGVILRRKVEITSPPKTPQQTEQTHPAARFIMPAPPTIGERATMLAQDPMVILISKGMLFCLKLVTLSWPCSPYAASPWIFYPLMVLSVVDFLLHFGLLESLMLFVLHLLICFTANQGGQLCKHTVPLWDHV